MNTVTKYLITSIVILASIKLMRSNPQRESWLTFTKDIPLRKSLGYVLSLLTLPVATIAARKHAQDCEASAVMQQLNMQTEYKLEEQKQEVANEKELSAYSAMQENEIFGYGSAI